MENRFQRIFLIIMFASSCIVSSGAMAQDDEEEAVLDAVISPDVERRKIKEDKIDVENLEFGMFTGVMSVEDFGTNNVYGMDLSYHITEDLFLEFAYGATKTTETSFEVLSGGDDLLVDEQRDLSYFQVSFGLNVLPGEVFVGRRYAFNTNYYLAAGVGNTNFADDEFFTTHYGAGFRMYATDWLAFKMGFRHHVFTHNILGEDKSVQNMEAHIGLSLFL